MFKLNNKDTKTMPLFFIVNFEHISHFVRAFLLLTLNMLLPAGNASVIPPQDILAATKYFKYEVIFKYFKYFKYENPWLHFSHHKNINFP